MEQKIKYQYTYFIYPYLIKPNNYAKYIYRLLKKPQCKPKFFDPQKDIQIDSYFLPEIKNKMFWSFNLDKQSLKDYEKLDLKLKSTLLSQKYCNFFEYSLDQDIPAKMGEKDGIFFDINKVEIVCFKTGICFLLMKTTLSAGATLEDVLNFNYKFRDLQSKIGHQKEYDTIKIQTQKLDNMQKFSEFIEEIAGPNLLSKKINLDTDRLITYSYVCLNQDSWNENTDLKLLEKQFEKFYHIKPAGEQLDDGIRLKERVYQEKYCYYGFSSSSTMLFTSESNMKNYTNLPFNFENEQLCHFLYHLYQKIYLKKLNFDFQKTKNFEKVKKDFLEFAKKDWIYEVTSETQGIILEKYYKQEQGLEQIFVKLKGEYDLLYKEYQVEKMTKHYEKLLMVVGVIIILNIIYLIWRK